MTVTEVLLRPMAAAELLSLWEQLAADPPFRKAQVLLEASCPQLSGDEVAELPIGRRDRTLLELRKLTFGPRMNGVASCPACGSELEIGLDPGAIAAPASSSDQTNEVHIDDFLVRFRLPTGRDLQLAEALSREGDAPEQLLRLCTVAATHRGTVIDPSSLPPTVVEAVAHRMSEADPQAEVMLSLTCPACRHGWQTLFDVVESFWSEIDAWARRALREVHVIASAYGWSEADILAMSPNRRRRYLELIG